MPAAPTLRPIVNEAGEVGQFRLEVETSGATLSHFLHVLQAKGAADATVGASVADQGSAYALTIVHPTYGTVSLTLLKGSQSAGGAITIGGNTTALTAGVQSVTVGDAGVVWGGSAPAPTSRRPRRATCASCPDRTPVGGTVTSPGSPAR